MSLTNPPPLVRVTFKGGPLDGKSKILTASDSKTSYAHPHDKDVAAVYTVIGAAATFDSFVDSRTGAVITI